MKITILGSSHGVPEPNRRCACTMLQVGGNTYFVDMGMPAIDELVRRGIPVDSVRGIFITHMHGDHTDGLIQFVDLITWYYRSADPQICLPGEGMEKALTEWVKAVGNTPRPLRYSGIREGLIFDDGTVKVTAMPTQHCPGSRALLVEAEGKRILFTGDLAGPGKDFPAVDGTVELMLCESAHFPATEYIPVLEKWKPEKICVTHYVPRFIPSVLELKDAADRPLVFASDGLEFEL